MGSAWVAATHDGRVDAVRVSLVAAADIDGALPAAFAVVRPEDASASPGRYSGLVADRFSEKWAYPAVGEPRHVRFWRAEPGEQLSHTIERAQSTPPQAWYLICATRFEAEDPGYSGE
ncbi:hypothetical protein [Mesorhizobium japonicum]|uniref:hypothetical protein n=1 Tax=Mesorhizobium japonicum TaxID=2066070 RepID=UPI003B5AAEB6